MAIIIDTKEIIITVSTFDSVRFLPIKSTNDTIARKFQALSMSGDLVTFPPFGYDTPARITECRNQGGGVFDVTVERVRL